MATPALTSWKTTRRTRLAGLLELHELVLDRSWDLHAEQVVWSFVLRLAAEFQGFVRDLHDQAVQDVVAGLLGVGSAGDLVAEALVLQRGIDRANATSVTLIADFRRLGLEFWRDLRARSAETDAWRTSLEALNRCRNALAHDQPSVLAELARQGWRTDAAAMWRWWNSLDSLAVAMDHLVRVQVSRVLAGAPARMERRD